MTIEELYKWAIDNGVEKYNIEARDNNDGGSYVELIGADIDLDINFRNRTVRIL